MTDSMSERPDSFRSVVELWPTRKAMAEAMAARGADPGADAISKWWRRDAIPSLWWSRVVATDEAKAAGVTAELLAELEARTTSRLESAEARP